MKYNQKTIKGQSMGYEPKEYARFDRQKKGKINKGYAILEIIKYDNEARLRQYKKYLINLHEMYKYFTYGYGEITKRTIIQAVMENKAYNCFYFLMEMCKENQFSFIDKIPYDFMEFYVEKRKIEQRKLKIKQLKEKIKTA